MGYAGARDRQLSLRFLDPSLLGCHLGLGRGRIGDSCLIRGTSIIRVARRDRSTLHEGGLAFKTLTRKTNCHLVPLRIRLRLGPLGDSSVHPSLRRGHLLLSNSYSLFCNLDLCPCVLDAGIKKLRIKQGNWLVLVHAVVVVDKNLLYLARDLRANNHADDGLDSASGNCFGDSLTATDLRKLIGGQKVLLRRSRDRDPKQNHANGKQRQLPHVYAQETREYGVGSDYRPNPHCLILPIICYTRRPGLCTADLEDFCRSP